MFDGLTPRRRRDLKIVGLLTVGIILVAWFVARLADRAWAAHGVGYTAVHGTASVLGVGLHALIAFVTGVPIAWLALMVVDRSKRIQSPAIVVLVVVFVGVLLSRGRLWVVDWLANVLPLVAGLGVGLLTGGWTAVFTSRIEFPAAAIGLYTLAILLVLTSILDAYVLGGWFLGDPSSLMGYLDAAITLGAGIAFVGLVGGFVRYRDQRRVAIVGSDSSGAAVVTGLVNHVQSDFDSRLISGGETIGIAPGKLRNGNDPNPLSETVAVEYRSPQLLSRWIRITATPMDLSTLDREMAAREPTGPLDSAADLFVGPYREFVRTRAGLDTSPQRTVAGADVVVFVFSMREFFPPGAVVDDLDPWELETPIDGDVLRDVSESLGPETRVLLAIYDGDYARRITDGADGATPLNDSAITDTIKTPLPFVPAAIVVMDALGEAELVTGSSELRRRLDRRAG
ncbi:MAG: hypothetical protein ABEJ60_03240 [Halodesulfurarchaeum sp.]